MTDLTGRVNANHEAIRDALGEKSAQLAALTSGMSAVSATPDCLVLLVRYPKHAQMIAARSDVVLAVIEEVLGVSISRLEVRHNNGTPM